MLDCKWVDITKPIRRLTTWELMTCGGSVTLLPEISLYLKAMPIGISKLERCQRTTTIVLEVITEIGPRTLMQQQQSAHASTYFKVLVHKLSFICLCYQDTCISITLSKSWQRALARTRWSCAQTLLPTSLLFVTLRHTLFWPLAWLEGSRG